MFRNIPGRYPLDNITTPHHPPPPGCDNQKCLQRRASLLVQWLSLCAPTAGGVGSVPGQELRSCMLRLAARKKKNSVFRLCLIPLWADLGEAQNYSQLSTVELEECKNGL